MCVTPVNRGKIQPFQFRIPLFIPLLTMNRWWLKLDRVETGSGWVTKSHKQVLAKPGRVVTGFREERIGFDRFETISQLV
ncbi:hypothetical protein HanIR_Chr08g0384671 [Helianthus annuus]|nr:hypothetical protein HanIR_Chr08g0384671 [Helianthus annuus]